MDNKYILVLNAGSSSLKFGVFDSNNLQQKANGICERIGIDGWFNISYQLRSDNVRFGKEVEKLELDAEFKNHEQAIDFLLIKLIQLAIIENEEEIIGIGHRIVQGTNISDSCLVDKKIIKIIQKNIKLAPLHNKPELDVLKITMEKMQNSKNVVVFDTSFHTTIPKINYHYAIPNEWIEKYGIRKYGFHGTSYRFVNDKMSSILNLYRPLNLIVCHLGNGASVCCIKNGKSLDTSMGLTPLSGLVMGTRCGDIDPSIFDLISREEKIPTNKIYDELNKNSGFKAICNATDFRDINQNIRPGNEFEFARDIFVQKIVNYIAIYKNMLNDDVDGIVFAGGIGENSSIIRKMVCEKIVGTNIDNELNETEIGEYKLISKPLSRYKVFVVRTNEELKIAQDVKRFL